MISPRAVLSVCVVLLAGFAIFWQGTDGWAAWTAEAARREAVRNRPLELPRVDLSDQFGSKLEIDRRGEILLVDFIFTRCPTQCVALGSEFRWLQDRIRQNGYDDRVSLISLSFDFENDGAEELSDYLARYSAQPAIWKAGRFTRRDDLETLMRSMGIVAIPDERFGFIHNAAIYLLIDGKLTGIYDLGHPGRVLDEIEWLLSRT